MTLTEPDLMFKQANVNLMFWLNPVVCAAHVQTHPLVIHSEVIIELDDALGLLLELSVGVFRPPLFEIAMAVVLAP